MSVRRMINPIVDYAWGSRDGIAAMQNRPPAEQPEAEMWMGAHPHAPSLVLDHDGSSASLHDLIAADAVGMLGADCVQRFGPRLPFLLKVLSAAKPLSLQVHPDADLARAGFAAEDSAGVDQRAADRVYRDPYGKPEMLVALGEFTLLQGFRPADCAARCLEELAVPALVDVVAALRSGTPTGDVFLRLLAWPEPGRAQLVAATAAAVDALTDADAAYAPWIRSLAADYPHDPAVVGVLLLNLVTLHAGQALYVAPGHIHAYLRGTGVEILGGSDNVVRGGLTTKHIDIEQLQRLLVLKATMPAILEPTKIADAEDGWPVSQPEFALSRIRVDGVVPILPRLGAEILLCVDGLVQVGTDEGAVTLASGESAFVRAGVDLVTLDGVATVMRATPGALTSAARVTS